MAQRNGKELNPGMENVQRGFSLLGYRLIGVCMILLGSYIGGNGLYWSSQNGNDPWFGFGIAAIGIIIALAGYLFGDFR
jgi:hypothetical protein